MNKDERGFTLLEVIVAITISSVILAVVFMFLHQGLFTWENIDAEGDWEQNWRIFSKHINSDLHNLFYSPLYSNNIFEGDYQGLRFIIIKNDQLMEVGYRVDYYSKKIIREEKPHQSDTNTYNPVRVDKMQKTEYFQDIFRVDYEYFDAENNYSVYWSIKERGFLPSLVKVTITCETQELTPLSVEVYTTRKYERGVSIYE